MPARIEALERRIDELEEALEIQGVMLGRWLGLIDPAARSPASAWLTSLQRSRRDVIETRIGKRLMDAPGWGWANELPPAMDALRLPE